MSSADVPVRRDTDGNPVWTFRVTEALLQFNRRTAFPREVAAHLGCKPGALTRVAVEDPAGCRKLKVCLERGNPPRTIVLNLADPLKGMGVAQAQSVDLVITGPQRVALRRNESSRLAGPTAEPRNLDPADGSPSYTPEGPRVPWGRPPTPLLPSWYFENHGETPLAKEFTSIYPSMRRLADLDGFWDHYDDPLDRDGGCGLRDLARRLMPPKRLRVLPPDFSLGTLNRLPLLNRTRNCVRRGLERGTLDNGTVEDLMRLPNFGITSLLDLMCVLEAAEGIPEDSVNATAPSAATTTAEPTRPAAASARKVVTHDEAASSDVAELLAAVLPRWSLAIRSTALTCDAAELVVAAACELRGATNLGDLLRLDLSDLISAAAADSALAEVPLDDDAPRLADRAVAAVDACLGRMSGTRRLVALERVAASAPKSLEEIAGLAGLSRERIRQLEKQVRVTLEEAAGPALGLLSLVASERLGVATTRLEIENVVAELLPSSESDASSIDIQEHSLETTRRMLESRLDYRCREDLCLSSSAARTAIDITARSGDMADDAGLIDDELLHEQMGPELRDDADSLVRWIGWPRLSGQVALRDTHRARAKASLLKLGAPATKAEIAEIGGLTEKQVAGALSNLPSVARADKTRWGLREWIDDVYEGIPAEIVQRINEDGGSTRLNRVLDELPRFFGVSEGSVWAFLNTPAFRVEYGWVTEVTDPGIGLGRLEDVIDGHDDMGDPYWTFRVYGRHREGYSLHGVPPEVAATLGCNFGTRASASVRSPHGCQDISVIWRKTSIHGPEIGRLSPAIRALEAGEGDLVSLIIHSPSEVSFDLNVTLGGSSPKHHPRPATGPAPGVLLIETQSGVTPAAPLTAKLAPTTEQDPNARSC